MADDGHCKNAHRVLGFCRAPFRGARHAELSLSTLRHTPALSSAKGMEKQAFGIITSPHTHALKRMSTPSREASFGPLEGPQMPNFDIKGIWIHISVPELARTMTSTSPPASLGRVSLVCETQVVPTSSYLGLCCGL